MQRKLTIHRWLLMAWFMLGGWLTSSAAVYPQTTNYSQYSSYPQYSQYPQTTQLNTTAPTYQFRTTSAFMKGTTTTSTFTPLADTPSGSYSPKIRKWGSGDPEDEPVGETPLGSPLVLLLFALLFLCYRYFRYRYSCPRSFSSPKKQSQ